LKKTYRLVALILVALVFVFAIVSFLRENWTADRAPGRLESFLAGWLLGRAPASEADAENPFPATEQNLAEGRQNYEKQCAFCHGLDGKGQGPSGIQFYPPVPSLAQPEEELPDGQVHFVVTKGIRYTAMPSFAKVLTDEEIWKITLWVRQLAQSGVSTPAAPAPTPNP
jgi:mono/diheme cytochrome c family protein